MSDTDTEDSTAVLPAVADGKPAEPAAAEQEPKPDALGSGLPAVLAAAAPRRWWNKTTLLLLAVALPACGFLGGVQAQQRWGKTTVATTTRTGTGAGTGSAGAGASFGPPGGTFGRPGGGAGTATEGTVTSITDGTLTMRTAAGATVIVKIAGSTKMQRTMNSAELTPGQSVTVQGSAGTDGTVTATTVTAS